VEQYSKRPAAKMDQPVGAGLLERISWDDLRIFVVVVRTLSFRKAATALRTSSSTITRRMERLEETFGFRLFDRLPDGVGLTAEGRSVYASAQQMERASHSLRAHLDQGPTTRGIVRCSVTEGLGTLWVLPHVAEYSRTHPTTIVDLHCSLEVADILRMEADVAIQLEKPDRLEVKALRLGRMHFYPFASRRYIDTYGIPKTREDVKHHRLVHQKGPQVEEDGVQRALDIPNIEGLVALRTNASLTHLCAVELGMGIGGLPTYLAAVGSDLTPIDMGVRHHVDIWMTYHPDARSIRRVASFIDWLRTLFDPKCYPWFSDEFIHPREIAGSQTPQPEKAMLPMLRYAAKLKRA
jgi:DNA-binding transcriptional LysR family regulator